MNFTTCPTCGHGPADHSCEGYQEDGSDFWFCFAREADDSPRGFSVCGCGDPRQQ